MGLTGFRRPGNTHPPGNMIRACKRDTSKGRINRAKVILAIHIVRGFENIHDRYEYNRSYLSERLKRKAEKRLVSNLFPSLVLLTRPEPRWQINGLVPVSHSCFGLPGATVLYMV
jgi:hypothetical protein